MMKTALAYCAKIATWLSISVSVASVLLWIHFERVKDVHMEAEDVSRDILYGRPMMSAEHRRETERCFDGIEEFHGERQRANDRSAITSMIVAGAAFILSYLCAGVHVRLSRDSEAGPLLRLYHDRLIPAAAIFGFIALLMLIAWVLSLPPDWD